MWEREIPTALQRIDAVLICLSSKSIGKTGYLQREIKFALDAAEEQSDDSIFLIPGRLEPCEVPERLRRWQWVVCSPGTATIGWLRHYRPARSRWAGGPFISKTTQAWAKSYER